MTRPAVVHWPISRRQARSQTVGPRDASERHEVAERGRHQLAAPFHVQPAWPGCRVDAWRGSRREAHARYARAWAFPGSLRMVRPRASRLGCLEALTAGAL